MADISSTIKQIAGPYNTMGGFTDVRWYKWEPVADGTSTVATHNIVPIPVGEALAFAIGYVETAFTSAGSSTHQFQVGSDTLTGAIPKANLAAGDVIMIGFDANDDTTSAAKYAKSAADTLDVAVGTAAVTAGKLYLQCFFVDVNALTGQRNS